MVANRENHASQHRFPRPATLSDVDDVEITSTQTDPKMKIKQVRWTDDMDKILVSSLLHQKLGSSKRSDNGFNAFQLSKVVDSVFTGLGIVVSVTNVRSRLKTLKKEYAEVHQLLTVSGFGINSVTGRVTADPVAWEDLVKDKPEFDKWKTRLCPRYDEMEAIFGNDLATGDRAVTGFDNFSPIHIDKNVDEMDQATEGTDPSPTTSRKRQSEDGSRKPKRRHAQQVDESALALATLAESSKEIANALKVQATLDTMNHVNWPLIQEKLQGMGLDDTEVVLMMKKIHTDKGLGVMFMSFTNESLMRTFVYMELGRNPPPV